MHDKTRVHRHAPLLLFLPNIKTTLTAIPPLPFWAITCSLTFIFTKLDTTCINLLPNHQPPRPHYLCNHPVTAKQAAARLS
jgi:hypothetical protein